MRCSRRRRQGGGPAFHTIYFTLPRSTRLSGRLQPPSPPGAPRVKVAGWGIGADCGLGMTSVNSVETVLIVDDEEPVRRTFREWLEGADFGCRVLTAGNAADALRLADGQPIDLAILDWNLGAGSDGLQLLEDLKEFSPEVVAVMITGYANQATPLMAMRMGVRDYLDKNQDLNRETFLRAVVHQLD